MFAIPTLAIVMSAASWESPMRQARSGCRLLLLAQEVIGALREAGFKDESSGEQGREISTFAKKEETKDIL